MVQANDTQPDPAALLAAVGWPSPVSVRQVKGGWDALIWRVVTPDGMAHALRLFRTGAPGRTRALAEREALAMQAAIASALPVPPVEAIGEYAGRAFLIMRWASGRPLLNVLQTRPWRLPRLGREFGRVQARFHAIAPPAGLPLLDLERWSRRIGDDALIDAIRQRGAGQEFCHGDFHPTNVLCDGERITAVIDFANAVTADRRIDLAWTNAVLVAAPVPPGPGKPVIDLFRRLFAHAWREGYRAEAGTFPLDPLSAAFGAAATFQDIEDSVRDGRGWARPADLVGMRRFIAERRRAASLPARRVPSAE